MIVVGFRSRLTYMHDTDRDLSSARQNWHWITIIVFSLELGKCSSLVMIGLQLAEPKKRATNSDESLDGNNSVGRQRVSTGPGN